MKRILIIGGGISGAATLHFLKQKYAGSSQVDIKLLERNPRMGGTVGTTHKSGALFESGPNGFLDNSPDTLTLIDQLKLNDQLIQADALSKKRYIFYQNKFYALPSGPISFLTFPLLPLKEKLNILKALFVPLKLSDQMTVAEFAQKNIGPKFRKLLMDPMIGGIFGGNIDALNLKACFPRLSAILNSGDSLFTCQKKKTRKTKTHLHSFQKGMQTIIDQITDENRRDIIPKIQTRSITKDGKTFVVQTDEQTYTADTVILSTPAFVASKLLTNLNRDMAHSLAKIIYAPIAVVGFKFNSNDFEKFPQGFGTLIPSCENNNVLGILFEHQIYPMRYDDDSIVVRIMLGGAHHPNIVNKSEQEITTQALEAFRQMFQTQKKPKSSYFKLWQKAIPQYTNDHIAQMHIVRRGLKKYPNLHIVANYYNGVSFNDCIKNAKLTAESIPL